MIRVTFEILPGGREERKRTIGLLELANLKVNEDNFGSYVVTMAKTPPFRGALKTAWKRGRVTVTNEVLQTLESFEDDDLLVANFGGFHRTRRGVYDLLYRALVACGIDKRNPDA